MMLSITVLSAIMLTVAIFIAMLSAIMLTVILLNAWTNFSLQDEPWAEFFWLMG